MAKAILIKQVKSKSRVAADQKKILKSVGVRGIGSSIYRSDTRALRGMLNQIQHLITAEQVERSPSKRPLKIESKFKGYKIG